MMNLRLKRTSVTLALSLLVAGSAIDKSEGFISRPSRFASNLPCNPLLTGEIIFTEGGFPSLRRQSRSLSSPNHLAAGYRYKSHDCDLEKSVNSLKRRHKRKVLLASLVITVVAALVFPLRAAASTVIDPAVATATLSASSAAPVAASVPTATVVAPYLTAASPVSPAVEMKLSGRLLYAALMGAALGKERSFAKHSAGVRTMALVAMGASAFTICSAYGFLAFDHLKCDPSRMASNVASGVGFVGAGVITTTACDTRQNVVHGLTTAATIWLSAAVGVACGVGLFRIATTAAATTIGILRLGRVKPKNRRYNQVPSNYQRDNSQPLFHEDQTEDHAEIHVTSVWDEHVEHDDHQPHRAPSKEKTHYEVTNEQTDATKEKPKSIRKDIERPSKRIVMPDDPEMEDVVKAAWRNSTIKTHQHYIEKEPKRSSRLP